MNESNTGNYKSVTDYFKQRDKNRDSNRIVIEFDGNRITQREYWQRVESYKQYFLSNGFFYGCEKPVTICSLNAPEYEFFYIALLELGAIVSTVSLSFLKSDIIRHTTDKGADTIILSAEFISPELKEAFGHLRDNNGEQRIKKIIFTSAGDYRPEEKAVAYNNQFDYKAMIDYLDLPRNIEVIYPGVLKNMANGPTLSVIDENVSLLSLVATYSNTGGTTTGIPKCAVHTHEAIINLLKAHEEKMYPGYPLREGDKSLLLIPISHITAQFYALLVRRAMGANIVYNPGAFEPRQIAKALIESEINDVTAPFGLYNAVAQSNLNKGDLKNLRIPTCGGEPTPLAPTKYVNKRLTWAGAEPIICGGGSTEFGSATIAAFGIDDRCNETGLSLPGVENIIINPLTGKKANDGEYGILYTNCPWQMKEYLNNEIDTKKFFNYKDEYGKVFGTNNDIGRVVREYNGKPVFAMCGRVNDFTLRASDTKRFVSGITFNKGKVNPVDLNKGFFLFNMRDKVLSVRGVTEAEAVLIPFDDNNETGTPVVNVVIAPEAQPVNVLRAIYEAYTSEDEFLPEGIIFRSNFARSLATDKRETVSLCRDRSGYYCVGADGNVYSVELPKGEAPVRKPVTDTEVVYNIAPPVQRKAKRQEVSVAV